MTNKLTKAIAYSALLLATVAPIACTPVQSEFREVTAEHIARPAFMVERKLGADGMDFQLWERTHQRFAPANIYIEGDGHIKSDNGFLVGDPSPSNPVALHLASRDLAQNVIYIARPCQFRESQDKDKCNDKFWLNRRFSPEVIAAYNDVLEELKKRWDITEFNIIGYDGGANIAAALAAQRTDIVTLRTVAGILNPQMVYAAKKETIDSDSITAKGLAPQLAKMPQHHFIGAGDTYVPPGIYHSYRQAMGDSECVHYSFVQDADHERGWVEKWPELLKSTVSCPQQQTQSYDQGEVFMPTTPLPPVPPEIHNIDKP